MAKYSMYSNPYFETAFEQILGGTKKSNSAKPDTPSGGLSQSVQEKFRTGGNIGNTLNPSGKTADKPSDKISDTTRVKSQVGPVPTPAVDENILSFDSDNLIRGIIFSEILGKPKGRRIRW